MTLLSVMLLHCCTITCSQHGRGSNFRNERYRSVPLKRGFSDSWFSSGLLDRVPGLLEFDYVSTSRPPLLLVQPVTAAQLGVLMEECGLRRVTSAAAAATNGFSNGSFSGSFNCASPRSGSATATPRALAAAAAVTVTPVGGATAAAAAAESDGFADESPRQQPRQHLLPLMHVRSSGIGLGLSSSASGSSSSAAVVAAAAAAASTPQARLQTLLAAAAVMRPPKAPGPTPAVLALSRPGVHDALQQQLGVSTTAAAAAAAAVTAASTAAAAAAAALGVRAEDLQLQGDAASLLEQGELTAWTPKPSAGVQSLEECLQECGVTAAHWPQRTLQSLFKHLLLHDCALAVTASARSRGTDSCSSASAAAAAAKAQWRQQRQAHQLQQQQQQRHDSSVFGAHITALLGADSMADVLAPLTAAAAATATATDTATDTAAAAVQHCPAPTARLIAHVVKVRFCHSTLELTLERVPGPNDAPALSIGSSFGSSFGSVLGSNTFSAPSLSRSYLGKRLKLKGARSAQDPQGAAMALLREQFAPFLPATAAADDAANTSIWLTGRGTECSGESPLCPSSGSASEGLRSTVVTHIL
jgi:trimeric autotransporter adhesin